MVRRDTRKIGDTAARVLLAALGAGPDVPDTELKLPTDFGAAELRAGLGGALVARGRMPPASYPGEQLLLALGRQALADPA